MIVDTIHTNTTLHPIQLYECNKKDLWFYKTEVNLSNEQQIDFLQFMYLWLGFWQYIEKGRTEQNSWVGDFLGGTKPKTLFTE